jgi:RimJ/RimL family protein N-acetyltransferase
MLNGNLFHGELVRLMVVDAEQYAREFSRWSRDTEYWRYLSAAASYPHSIKAVQEWIEKERGKDPLVSYEFSIHRLADDKLIGEISIEAIAWNHGEAFVGISIGERDEWGKGYGTDAMSVALRFAFNELNLQRVSLNVFSYNLRAIRSYEKAGFVHEGRQRGNLLKEGSRFDLIYMGILKDEWLATNQPGGNGRQ